MYSLYLFGSGGIAADTATDYIRKKPLTSEMVATNLII